MKKLNNFLNFEIDGLDKVNGGIMALMNIKTIIVTNCDSDDPDDGGEDED